MEKISVLPPLRTPMNSLLIADDLVPLASSQEDLQHALGRYSVACHQAGMKISTKQKKQLFIPALSQQSLPRLEWVYCYALSWQAVDEWIPLRGRLCRLRLNLLGCSLFFIQIYVPDVWPSGESARFMSGRSLFVWFESRPGRAKTLKIGTCFSLAKRSA